MDTDKFINLCKNELLKYFNEHNDKTNNFVLNESNIFVVWYSRILQNNKALLSTTIPDGMYYEFTYNGDKNELYVDAYKKWENVSKVIE